MRMRSVLARVGIPPTTEARHTSPSFLGRAASSFLSRWPAVLHLVLVGTLVCALVFWGCLVLWVVLRLARTRGKGDGELFSPDADE